MFKTKNDLSGATRVKTVELLNARLADCKDLQTQTKQGEIRCQFTILARKDELRPDYAPSG